MSIFYDTAADVLYVSFDRTLPATDSEMLDEETVVRYAGEKVIGVTLLHARRQAELAGENSVAAQS